MYQFPPHETAVAVFMITYNHGPFIEQAVESVMAQQTQYPFRLFIGEDCSTDNTRELCIKLKEKYPDQISLILQPHNVGMIENVRMVYDHCYQSGAQYTALLEGDDYWTDPYKLQKQIDFLESNPDAALCIHPVRIWIEQEQKFINPPLLTPGWHTTESIIAKWSFNTSSFLFRSEVLKDLSFVLKQFCGDQPIALLLSTMGTVFAMPDSMSVYRVSAVGITHGSNDFRSQKRIRGEETMFTDFDRLTNGKFKKLIQQRLFDVYVDEIRQLANHTNKKITLKLVVDMIRKFPALSFAHRNTIVGDFILDYILDIRLTAESKKRMR